MKIIKLAVISLIVFSLMLLAFTLVMPSHIRVSRAANIYAQPVKVQQAIKELKASDSNFVYQYMVIPFDTVTTLQLYYDFHIKWYNPFQKLGSIVYDKQVGPVMELYLMKFKKELE